MKTIKVKNLPKKLKDMVNSPNEKLDEIIDDLRYVLNNTKSYTKKQYTKDEVMYVLNLLIPKSIHYKHVLKKNTENMKNITTKIVL